MTVIDNRTKKEPTAQELAVAPTVQPAAAEAPPPRLPERKRIPVSTPQRKLEVPEIPGYHCYWPLESQVPRYLQGGYEFVSASEVSLNQFNPGASAEDSGNVDMGDRVRVVAGIGADGKPEYHVLMKIREEWYKEDQQVLAARNKSVVDNLRRRIAPKDERPDDANKTYIKQADLETHTVRRRPANG